MTEKEKMLAGQPYILDKELYKCLEKAKKFAQKYTKLPFQKRNKKAKMLRQTLGSIGKEVNIVAPFNIDYGYNIHIGDNFFANVNLCILDCGKVTIGNNVMFGPNVSLLATEHPLPSAKRQTIIPMPINIADDVWIGAGTTILGGISIGKGSVIGAGSVVTKDIPPDVVAVGNPCRIIKEIEDND